MHLFSSSFPRFRPRPASGALLALALLLSACGTTGGSRSSLQAERAAAGIRGAFPVETIASPESAVQAKAFVVQERRQVLDDFATKEQACYDAFFTTRCLDAAKESKRLSLNAIREIEVAADAFLRRDRVRQRDAALAEKRARDEGKFYEGSALPGEMPTPGQPGAAEETVFPHDAAPPRQRPAAEAPAPSGPDPRVLRHQEERRQREAEEAARAAEREENARKFEQKRQEAETRQREIAGAKAEKALKEAQEKEQE